MSEPKSQLSEALVHLEYLRADVAEIKGEVKDQSDRIRRVEHGLVRIKTDGRGIGVGWGTGGGVLGGMVAGFIQHWFEPK